MHRGKPHKIKKKKGNPGGSSYGFSKKFCKRAKHKTCPKSPAYK